MRFGEARYVARRSDRVTSECPWYLSARSVKDLARILYLDPESDADFDEAERVLFAIVEARHDHKIEANGLETWRASIPESERSKRDERARLQGKQPSRENRLVLVVSTKERSEGELQQLVSVVLRGR